MGGNVSEWTRSTYRPYPYDPGDGRETMTAEGDKVVRGGSWYDNARYLRAHLRSKHDPNNRNDDIGFRVSRNF